MIRWAARHPIVPFALIGIVLFLSAASVRRMPITYLSGQARTPLWAALSVPDAPGREVILDRLVRPLERRLLAEPSVAHSSVQVYADSADFTLDLHPGEDAEEVAGRLRELAESVAQAGPPRTQAWVSR